MNKEDDEFLARVAKEAPELLHASVDEQRFDDALEQMFKAPPVGPAKRKKRIKKKTK
jgi:hypothetical protein